ncbi:MAG: hypothetical protein WC655_28095 [Candidatus Hydrogenedentales bacterium]
MAINKERPEALIVALIPILVFLVLDAYYLALENAFRNAYSRFVASARGDVTTLESLFVIEPVYSRGKVMDTLVRVVSFSVFPMYSMLAGSVVVLIVCAA